jgi:D-sedoheptulose 7-phosphate isomerase
MALLSFCGISTPSLPAQGEQRRSPIFNIPRDIPLISDHFVASIAALLLAGEDRTLLVSCQRISEAFAAALRASGKLLFAGNGGSAGDAQHIAGEFVSRLNFDRAPLAALALTVDTSVLTAVGNDYGYERVFERQVLALGRAGDVFVGISTSGRSCNVLAALAAARKRGLTTIGFGGAGGGEMERFCDLLLAVPSTSTPLIQQIHIVAAHAICGQVEADLFEPSASNLA